MEEPLVVRLDADDGAVFALVETAGFTDTNGQVLFADGKLDCLVDLGRTAGGTALFGAKAFVRADEDEFSVGGGDLVHN